MSSADCCTLTDTFRLVVSDCGSHLHTQGWLIFAVVNVSSYSITSVSLIASCRCRAGDCKVLKTT